VLSAKYINVPLIVMSNNPISVLYACVHTCSDTCVVTCWDSQVSFLCSGPYSEQVLLNYYGFLHCPVFFLSRLKWFIFQVYSVVNGVVSLELIKHSHSSNR
jgi:hypothetical protein